MEADPRLASRRRRVSLRRAWVGSGPPERSEGGYDMQYGRGSSAWLADGVAEMATGRDGAYDLRMQFRHGRERMAMLSTGIETFLNGVLPGRMLSHGASLTRPQ